jgi:DNA-binding NarL/FixJ family response regulator
MCDLQAGEMLHSMALRCLIVDDNAAFVTAATGLLEREGVDVVGAAATVGAVAGLARELRPDVVLIDIDLGAENGFDAVHRLAVELGGDAPPTILISTYAANDFTELVGASPALGFVSKSELSRDALDALLSGRRGT